MRILSVGQLSGLSNTCLHRHWALIKCADTVDEVNTSMEHCTLWYRVAYHLFLYGLPVPLPESNDENNKICHLIDQNKYDVVWIDKGVTIRPQTLLYIKQKQPQCKLVSYSPDNMALRHNQSKQYLQCIPLYDHIYTNKSYILDAMRKLGARDIHFVNNTYEGSFHHPFKLTIEEKQSLGGDVGFVGAWEKERCESILYLVDHGIRIRVWGAGKWMNYANYSPNLLIEGKWLKGEDYSKALAAFRINLCFLRKMNFDTQTTRTVEIPACGGFMLAERTDEHLAMFNEDMEAAFFSSNEELLEKCNYYLSHEEERAAVALAGRNRCVESDYSNENMIKKILSICMKR